MKLLGAFGRGDIAIDHLSGNTPEFVLKVGFTAGEDLIGVTDGGFAFAAPIKEFLSQRIGEADLVIREGEETRESVAVEFSKFSARHPLQEGFYSFRVLCGGVHAATGRLGVAGISSAAGGITANTRIAHGCGIDRAGIAEAHTVPAPI